MGINRGFLEKYSSRKTILYYVVAFFILFLAFSLTKYYTLRSDWSYDLAVQNQAMWKIVNGKELKTELVGSDPNWYILYLISPIYMLWQHPETLLVIKCLVFALGGIAVRNIATRFTDKEIIVHLAILSYYLNGGTLILLLNDMHPDVMAFPLLLFASMYFLEERLLLFTLFGTLSILCRQDVVASVLLFAVFGLHRLRNRWMLSVASLAIVSAYILLSINTPFNWQEINLVDHMIMSKIQASMSEVAWNNNFIWLSLYVLVPAGILMLREGIGLLSLGIWILYLRIIGGALGGLNSWIMTVAAVHTMAVFLHIIIISGVIGIAKTMVHLSKDSQRIISIVLIMLMLANASIVIARFFDINAKGSPGYAIALEESHRLWTAFGIIPKDSSVAVPFQLMAPLSSRDHIYTYREMPSKIMLDKIEFLIVQKDHLNDIKEISRFEIFGETKNFQFFRNLHADCIGCR
jgi:uncharacterized membrane protein